MYLSQACLDHGQNGPLAIPCCNGYKAWTFDGKTGVPTPTGTHTCWSAQCIVEGQFAGPNGVGNYCCSPLVNINGKCAAATLPGDGTTTGCASGEMNIMGKCISQMLLIGGVAGLGLLIMISKKGKGAKGA